jgi:ferrous iron transport protein A
LNVIALEARKPAMVALSARDLAPIMTGQRTPLGLAQRGFRGHIEAIAVSADSSVPPAELERRLLELGFVEGAFVEVLHVGPVGRDPIAVRVNGTTIALRRREAMAILVG